MLLRISDIYFFGCESPLDWIRIALSSLSATWNSTHQHSLFIWERLNNRTLSRSECLVNFLTCLCFFIWSIGFSRFDLIDSPRDIDAPEFCWNTSWAKFSLQPRDFVPKSQQDVGHCYLFYKFSFTSMNYSHKHSDRREYQHKSKKGVLPVPRALIAPSHMLPCRLDRISGEAGTEWSIICNDIVLLFQ